MPIQIPATQAKHRLNDARGGEQEAPRKHKTPRRCLLGGILVEHRPTFQVDQSRSRVVEKVCSRSTTAPPSSSPSSPSTYTATPIVSVEGRVPNDCTEARGFWTGSNKLQHITFKELKVVRCAIDSFLPELKRMRLLLHEDNQSVVGVLTHLTSRSRAIVLEVRELFILTDEHNISIRTRYIHSIANV